jgi:hypothetical protein
MDKRFIQHFLFSEPHVEEADGTPVKLEQTIMQNFIAALFRKLTVNICFEKVY